MDWRDRNARARRCASLDRGRQAARAALIVLIAFATVAGNTPRAGAVVPPVPSLAMGSFWCGHFDHIASTVRPPHACPVPAPSPVTLVTPAPNGPFSSGQYIDVVVGPNSVLKPGRRVYIKECAAPNGNLPRSPKECDRRTVQHANVVVGANGTVSYPGYPILALPDHVLLGERSRHTPVCDLTHACILSVNEDRTDFDQPVVWSLPFFVSPTAGDTGANPGNGLPEVPTVVLLPIIAAAIFGGTLVVRRRRTGNRARRHLHAARP
jgi:hypothetical protein